MMSPETTNDILGEIARNLGRIADALESEGSIGYKLAALSSAAIAMIGDAHGLQHQAIEHNRIQRIVAEQLEKIAFDPRVEPGCRLAEPSSTTTPRVEPGRSPELLKALKLVRAILDLFDLEALISAELGEPIWEGRTKP